MSKNSTTTTMAGRSELPRGWAQAPLGDLVTILDNRRVPVNAEERATREGKVPYYGATGQAGWIDDFIFDEELVLLGEDAAPFLDPSKPVAYMIRGKSWVNNHAHVLRGGGAITNQFLLHQLNTTNYHPFVTGTTRLKLPQKPMRTIPLRLAPLAEQHRIVAEIEKQLTRLDDAVATLKRVETELERARASVLKAAVEGRLVPTEAALARAEGRTYEPATVLLERILEERRRRHEETNGKKKYKPPVEPETEGLPRLPEGWTWTSAESVCTGVDSGTTPEKIHFVDHAGIPFIKVYNLTFRGSLDFTVNPTFITRSYHDTKMSRSIAEPGDVLMNIVGPPLGKVSIVPDLHPSWNINQAIARFTPVPSANNKYLATYLQSPVAQRWLSSTAKTTTSQVNLSITTCRKLPVPLPPLAEQHRITAEVSRRLSVFDALEQTVHRNLTRCSHLRQSILKRAFSGKLVPQDPNDEPASALLARIRASAAAQRP